MREISEQEHNRILSSSLRKSINHYQTTMELKLRDLKLLDIVYRLQYDNCATLSHECQLKLNQLYYYIIRNNPLICSPNLISSGAKKNKFEYYNTKSTPIELLKYNQIFKPLDEIENNVTMHVKDGAMFSLNDFKAGYNFNISKNGRLIIESLIDLNNHIIKDILGNNITDAFSKKSENNRYYLTSKNFLAGDFITLKLVYNE